MSLPSEHRSFIAARRRLGLPPPPWIVGHRGSPRSAPENTLESLAAGAAQGADMVETDLQLTADGVLVACHDRTLERVAERPLEVEASTAAEIGHVELAAPMGGGPYRVPRLEDLFEALPADLPINLELKRFSASRVRVAEAVVGALDGRGRPLLVSSFDHELLAVVAAMAPDLPLAPIARRGGWKLAAGGRRLAAWSLHGRWSLVTARLVAGAAAAGRPVLAYTVNERTEAHRLLEMGVAGLFTDRPAELRDELGLDRP